MIQARKRIPGKSSPERGSVLMVAIMVIVAMLIISIPFLFKLSAQSRTTEKGYRSEAAFHLAEAGIEKTVWGLNIKLGGEIVDPEAIQWTTEGTNQVGVINDLKTSDDRAVGSINIIQGPPSATDPPIMVLQSTGMVPFIAGATVNRTVLATLLRYYEGIFDLGFFVDEYFYIHNAFFLDSYDSSEGAYGSTSADGTLNALGSTIFGTNSYVDADNPNDAGEASWVIDAGGQSSQVYGTIAAGGQAAEDTDPTTPNPDVLGDVVNVPTDDVFADDSVQSRMTMNDKYELPSVDVFDLPPKDYLGEQQDMASWFEGYTESNPQGATYYQYRMDRAPAAGEIAGSYLKGEYTIPEGGAVTLGPGDSGVYTSFSMGSESSGATLNIEGGNVTLFVTELDGSNAVGRFLMGPGSSINIADNASLTLVLGTTSFLVGKGYTINQTSGTPADCIIMGTDQFAFPPGTNIGQPSKLTLVEDIPGLMYFEQGAGAENGEIYAAIYVPRAHVTSGQGENHMSIYGAFLADSMDFKVQVEFHYDEALGALNILPGGWQYWRIMTWQELLGQNL